ncbi:Hypothetical predicted protein [Octopus vulgaris]|uniref:Uncharacterized protein n=1 Tax=Octopus vulgaris TaxID=6645 RepID=A0AA36F0P7_OCTVU|nr:Hypothetical predicted protein [Octopus vulgaris]
MRFVNLGKHAVIVVAVVVIGYEIFHCLFHFKLRVVVAVVVVHRCGLKDFFVEIFHSVNFFNVTSHKLYRKRIKEDIPRVPFFSYTVDATGKRMSVGKSQFYFPLEYTTNDSSKREKKTFSSIGKILGYQYPEVLYCRSSFVRCSMHDRITSH